MRQTSITRRKEGAVLRAPFAIPEVVRLQAQAICQVLNLVIGPIDLNLLSLRLQADTIRIGLIADSQGGILGQLLRSLAGPIAGNPLAQIVNLLN